METQLISIARISVGQRKRPIDAKVVEELKQSIDQQGLLQNIGVKQTADGYSLVYGAHRIEAIKALLWEEVPARVFPMDTPDDECLLAELQENKARKDLTGAERKAFAAEVGRILAKLQADGQSANGQSSWLVEMAKTTGTPFKTLQNWFTAFCQSRGLSITPTKATPEQQEDFFAWLDEQRKAEVEEKERKAAEAKAKKQEDDREDLFDYLNSISAEHGVDLTAQWINEWFKRDQ